MSSQYWLYLNAGLSLVMNVPSEDGQVAPQVGNGDEHVRDTSKGEQNAPREASRQFLFAY